MNAAVDPANLAEPAAAALWTVELVGPVSGDALEGEYVISNGDQRIVQRTTESAAGELAAALNGEDLNAELRRVLRKFCPHHDPATTDAVAAALAQLIDQLQSREAP